LRCHLEGEVVDPDLRIGGDLFEHVSPTLLDDAARIDPYGRPVELVYDGLPFLASRCAGEGAMTCTTCHDAHGSPHRGMMHEDAASSALCATCHPKIAGAVEAHSHHAEDAPGGRCVDCHMPGLVIERGHGVVTDHSISIPRLDVRGDRVAQDACTWCHTAGRGAPTGAPPIPAETLRERFAAWWPTARPPAAWMQVVARAREGVPDARDAAALTALIDDPAAPRVYRATAVRLLATIGEGARVALLEAARHEDSLVRREAVGALGAFRGEEVDAALRRALADDSWPVRSRAARAALEGWVRLRENEALRAPVLHALRADADAVPDDDLRWFRLGAAREISGDQAGAIEAYARQVALDPFAHGIREHLERLRSE
jgi:predicted CXXCH cytochrome family protein